MPKFESMNTILTKKLNNVIYELLVKTSANMVYTSPDTTLTETLSEITDILSTQGNTVDEVIASLNALTDNIEGIQSDMHDIVEYININGDPKSELIKLIENKQDSEEGKGLSECDFTEILRKKLVEGYTKDELDEKFGIIINTINMKMPEDIGNRLSVLEDKANIPVSEELSEEEARTLANGSIWFQIITK